MEQKKALNRKKLKVILVICIVMIVTAGIGLAVYIHHVDTVTLGRKVSVYRLDVSKLTVEEAQQKISEAFHYLQGLLWFLLYHITFLIYSNSTIKERLQTHIRFEAFA